MTGHGKLGKKKRQDFFSELNFLWKNRFLENQSSLLCFFLHCKNTDRLQDYTQQVRDDLIDELKMWARFLAKIEEEKTTAVWVKCTRWKVPLWTITPQKPRSMYQCVACQLVPKDVQEKSWNLCQTAVITVLGTTGMCGIFCWSRVYYIIRPTHWRNYKCLPHY